MTPKFLSKHKAPKLWEGVNTETLPNSLMNFLLLENPQVQKEIHLQSSPFSSQLCFLHWYWYLILETHGLDTPKVLDQPVTGQSSGQWTLPRLLWPAQFSVHTLDLHCTRPRAATVDGSEILRSPVDMVDIPLFTGL